MSKSNPKSIFYLLVVLVISAQLAAGCSSSPATTEAPTQAAPVLEETAAEPTQIPTEVPTEAPTEAPTEEPTADPADAAEEPVDEPAAPESNLTDACVEDYIEGTDYFPEKTTFEYAEGISVEYFNNYKVVTLTQPWIGAEEDFTYILVQCGTPPPEDVEGTVFEVPADTVISMSTTLLPGLDDLGLVDRIVALDSFAYPSNAAVRERIDAGELTEVGSGPTVNIEQILELNPSLILVSDSGSAEYDTHPTLSEAGLPVAIFAEWTEPTVFARAEWIKFTGLFYNLETEAAEVFENIVVNYNEVADLAATVEEKPTVLANVPWEGTWYVPGGSSYLAEMFADAGADYLWTDTEEGSTLYLDFETVFATAQDADIWINVTYPDLASMLAADERFAEFTAYQNGQVYANTAQTNEFGGNDFWESGVVHPETVLMDLVKIFHPDLLPDHELYYYQQLQ